MKARLEQVDSGILYANAFQGDWAINAYHPKILEVAPGELVCVYRRGAAMYSDDGRSWQLRSTDNGKTWQDEGCLWDGTDDAQSYMYSATSLAKVSDGEIVLTGFRTHRPTPDTLMYNEKTGVCLPEESILLRSADGGRSWSPPEVIARPETPLLEITGAVVECDDGRWLLPFDVSKAYDDPTPLHNAVLGLFSYDRGKTWEDLTPVAGGPDCDKTFWHAHLLKLTDGRIMTFPWTGDASGQTFLTLHRVVSEDSGRTWSTPRPTNVPGQTSYHVGLPNGLLALVYSWRETDTPGIYVTVSEDDGFAWDIDHQVRIWDAYGNESLGVARTATYPSSHDNIAFGAPHITHTANGDVLACFWGGTSGQMVCRYSRLRLV